MKTQRTSKGFTLIELIVVAAIVSILASLLWPSFSSAKVQAKQIQCFGHLRQLGIAAQLYWDDNGQRAFPYLSKRLTDGQVYWFGWLQSGSEGHRIFDPSQGALWPYLQSRGIELCPSFHYQHPKYKPKATGASWGYGYNLHLSPNNASTPMSKKTTTLIHQIRRPTEITLFADAAQINDFQPPASFENPLVEEFYYVSDGGPAYANGHFRHRRKANVVFVDGHAAALAPAPKSQDPRLPKMFLARLPKQNLIP